jgi:hypothetical protein
MVFSMKKDYDMSGFLLTRVLLIMLITVSQVYAVARYWFNTGGNNLWSNGANWGDSFTVAPQAGDTAFILNGQAPIGNTNACQFTSAMTASVTGVQVQAMGYNGTAGMDISGGTLTMNDFFVSSGTPGSGIVTMSGGIVTSTGYFVVGQSGGNGTLTMTGGVINVCNFWVSNLANSKGKVNLIGGTINISGTISIQGKNDAGFASEPTGHGLIDISGGKIVFTKNQDLVQLADGLCSAGLITAYGGRGTLIASRDPVSGYTIISAILKAGNTLSGDVNGDAAVDRKDLYLIAQQWLSAPGIVSADIAPAGGDGIVNFLDLAAMAKQFGYQPGTIYDFVTNASSAVWSDSKTEIVWGNNSITLDGAAYPTNGQLEDGVNYTNMIFNHPDYRSDVADGNHYIKGIYNNIIIPDIPGMMKFTAVVGMANGATNTDGVTFSLSICRNGKYYELAAVDIENDGLLNTLSADITAYKGETLTFILKVNANANPNCDWAVWKEAKIITYGNTIYDFVSNPPQTWSNSKIPFTWGSIDATNGAAYYSTGQLENSKTYIKRIFVHPDNIIGAAEHYVDGLYSVTIPNTYGSVKLIARVGLANDAAGSDGMGFAVIANPSPGVYETVCYTETTYDGRLEFLTADISKYKGQTLNFGLRAVSLNTTTSDNGVWVEAQIIGYEPEPVYDFVANASKAGYKTAAGTIEWGTSSSNGSAMLTTGQLEDGSICEYIYTHPDEAAGVTNHFVEAVFENVIIPDNLSKLKLQAIVGLSDGAGSSDVAIYKIFVERYGHRIELCSNTNTYDNTLASMTADLSGYEGSNINIILQVVPASDSYAGCAAWVKARISGQLPMQLHADDWGASVNDGTDDLAAFNKVTLKAKGMLPSEIYLSDGTYNMSNEWSLYALKNITIKGQGIGSEIMITNPRSKGFSVSLSSNIIIKELSLDYNPLPFTQGTIKAKTSGTFDVEFDSGFPLPTDSHFVDAAAHWGAIMENSIARPKWGAPSVVYVGTWTLVSGRTYRTTASSASISYMTINDRFTVIARDYGSVIQIAGSNNTKIDGVRVYSSPAAAVLTGDCNGVYAVGLQVRIKPGTTRIMSTNADGFHCSNDRGHPIVDGCYFEGMMDDGVNVYGSALVVQAVLSSTQAVLTNTHLLKLNDHVQIYNIQDGTMIANEAIISGISGTTITFDRAITGLAVGQHVYDVDNAGRYAQIVNNTFWRHRGRGVILKAQDSIISSNHMSEVSCNGIQVGDEMLVNEGPAPQNVTVSDNIIDNVGYASHIGPASNGSAILIRAQKTGGGLANGRLVRSITVQGNQINNPPGASIYVGSASGVNLVDNTETTASDAYFWRYSGSIIVDNSEKILLYGAAGNYCNDYHSPKQSTSALEIKSNCASGWTPDGIGWGNLYGNVTNVIDNR